MQSVALHLYIHMATIRVSDFEIVRILLDYSTGRKFLLYSVLDLL